MGEPIVVEIEMLRAAATLLLDHVENLSGKMIALRSDYYWSIPVEQANDIFHRPTEFTVGQVSECIENLGKYLDDPTKAISYGLVWLGELMRAVGQAVIA